VILVPRRRPAQQRSRERFDRILAAARPALVGGGGTGWGHPGGARWGEKTGEARGCL